MARQRTGYIDVIHTELWYNVWCAYPYNKLQTVYICVPPSLYVRIWYDMSVPVLIPVMRMWEMDE